MPSAMPPPDAHITYSRQYRRCQKPGCTRCAAGSAGHGPYWFAYWREDGRVRSRYLGKKAPIGVAQADPPPTVSAAPAPVTPDAALRVRALGGLDVWRGETLLDGAGWHRRAVRALFTCLLSAPEQRLHREQIKELLWPEEEPAAAARNLNTAVHLLRRLLATPGIGISPLRSRGDLLALEPVVGASPATHWLDAAAFTHAARVALAGTDPAVCRRALALYGGEYLADDLYAEWTIAPRHALREQYLRLLSHLATLSGASGDLEEAERCLRAVLATDPCNEDAAGPLMGMLAAAGRRADALRVYQTLATALETDLGLAPCAEIEALRGRLAAREATVAEANLPPRAARPAPPGNLPAPVTSFVGREWEQREIQSLLAPDEQAAGIPCRLLTLTGPGGCGKTRLAMEVAASLAETYPDGVWLVELAALTDETLIPRAVAIGLEIQDRQPLGSGEALTALREFLRPRRLLLLLDNCEHLAAGCAALASELLRGCPRLCILATSREALRAEGERIWRAAPLATPPPAAAQSPGSLSRYEAVRLFVDRARARRHDFALTEANAQTVARICRRLDGLPLAIELAAARLGVLPVEVIEARLDDCFQLLTGGSRTALPRQQTLRATMDWSFGLLSEPARSLFPRLSIFAGGWTLEAAEAICVESGPILIQDMLADLITRSLVQQVERAGVMRFRLLETVRQYGRARLEADGDVDQARRRHQAWFLDLLEQARAGLKTSARTTWLNRLEEDIDNLRAALSAAVAEPGDRKHVLTLAEPLAHFCLLRGYQAEGRRWLATALAAADAAPTTRAGALNAAGTLANEQGAYGAAMALYEEGLALYRELCDRRGVARLLINQGTVRKFQGDLLQARALYEAGLEAARGLGDTALLALALNNIGSVAIDLGDNAGAAAVLEESLILKRAGDHPEGVIITLINLAEIERALGNLERAMSLGEEALALAAAIDARRHSAHAHYNLGLAARAAGDLARAAVEFRAGLLLERELGNKRQIGAILEGLAGLAALHGDGRRAGLLFGAAEGLRERIGAPIPPADRAAHARDTAAARALLDGRAAAVVWARGRGLTLDAAIGEALDS